MTDSYEVYANGGVIFKKGGRDLNEIFYALIHRPRYDDWSIPKGKQEPGEKPLDCALREIAEETGYISVPVSELKSVSYTDNQGRSKLVRYWLVEPRSGQFSANQEVDALAWLPFPIAVNTLTYEFDRGVLDSARSILEK